MDRALDRCRDVLPARSSGLLAAACLPTGEHARSSLRAWLGADGDRTLRTIASQDRELLSCLEAARRDDDDGVDAEVRTALRAARLLEDVRGQGVAEAVGGVLDALREVGVVPIVVGGCAFAERIYGGWSRRHCGGLELVVRADELELVSTTLEAASTPSGLHATHTTGMAIHATDYLFAARRAGPASTDAPHPGTTQARVAGHEAWLLDDEWALVHALGVSGRHFSAAPWWAVDAGMVILRRPAVDWPLVVAIAEGNAAQLAVLARLIWLRDKAGVPVPKGVLHTLRRTAVRPAARVVLAPRSRLRRAARSVTVAIKPPR